MSRVLIVDDQPSRYEPLVAELVASEIDQNSIVFSTSVRDALTHLARDSFDVLIADMLLPETPWGQAVGDGGARLLMHLEEDPDLRTPKYIIGITAATEDDPSVRDLFANRPWLLLRAGGGGTPWLDRLAQLIQHAFGIEHDQDAGQYRTDVCFLTALKDPEFQALLDAGLDLDSPELVDTTTYARVGHLPTISRPLSLVAANCLRMGSTESALVASKLIQHFRPKLLLLVGICAGFEEKVQYGDVILADPCWDYTSAKIAVDERGERTVTYLPDYVSVDADIRSRFEILAEDTTFLGTIHKEWKGDKPRAQPMIKIAPSASGPAVIADANVLKEIRRTQNRATLGLEMEAYGVYCAARMATRPRPVVASLKSVCDYGTFLKDDKYQRYAASVSAAVAIEFCKRFGPELTALIG
jgi:nucleoside phosphorylase